MKSLNQIMQGIALVGQLGFGHGSTPPLVLIWLAHLAQTKLGWGMWTMVAAILIGLVTAAVSTMEHRAAASDEKERGKRKKRRLLQRTYLIEVDYEA